MTEKQEKTIDEWIDDARVLLKCYLSKAQRIKRQNRLLKIVSASVSTILLTLIFIFIRLELMNSDYYVIVLSVTGLLASILTVVVAFLNLAEDASKCDNSGSQYATIRKELEYLRDFESENSEFLKAELKRISSKWGFVRKNSIPITTKEIREIQKKYS